MKKVLVFIMPMIMFTSCSGQIDSRQKVLNYSGQTIGLSLGNIVPETSNDIWVIFQDKNNNYWFGSSQHGVYCYDGKTMTHFSSKDGLCHDRINEIKEDAWGNVYFSTPIGVSRFDGNRLTTLPVAAGKASTHTWKLEPGDMWFKGNNGGPYRYDGKMLYSLEFPKHYLEDAYYKQFPNTTINPYDVYYIYRDHTGNIWFGTGALGIFRYDGKKLSWLYEEHLTNIEGGGSFGIRSIMEDAKRKFWFCNTKYRYNVLHGEFPGKGKNFINYTREIGIDNIKSPTTGDRIYYQSIVEDQNGDLWLQTYRDGIWRYDGKKVTQYPVKDGAENVNVISMYQDKSGGLWLGTQDKGVFKFNGKIFEKFKYGKI